MFKNILKLVLITASLVFASYPGPILIPVAKAEKADYLTPIKIRTPKNNQMTPERVALGKILFFDPRLSDTNQMSCATCHNPSFNWTDGMAFSRGSNNKRLTRSTPTILNVAYNRVFFWDGRTSSLEEQAVGPIESTIEMNQNIDELVAELKAINGYPELFEKAYPGEGISKHTIGKAIASFERTIVSQNNAPFDRWIAGEKDAISESAKRGFKLFDGKGRCVACHSGPNFTDAGFHNIGLNNGDDIGRYKFNFVKLDILKGAFKTPTLRNVAKTAPYMHNGELKTMEEVIDHYIDGGKGKPNLSPEMKPIILSGREKADLIEFLNTLTEPQEPVTFPILPN